MQNSAKLSVAMTKCEKFSETRPLPSTDPTFPSRLWGFNFEPPPLQICGYATALSILTVTGLAKTLCIVPTWYVGQGGGAV